MRRIISISVRSEAVRTYRRHIDGTWSDADSGACFDDLEPYSSALYARIAAGGRSETKKAIAAANRAFPAWAAISPGEKAALFHRAADIVGQRRTDIAEILARETGNTMRKNPHQ